MLSCTVFMLLVAVAVSFLDTGPGVFSSLADGHPRATAHTSRDGERAMVVSVAIVWATWSGLLSRYTPFGQVSS